MTGVDLSSLLIQSCFHFSLALDGSHFTLFCSCDLDLDPITLIYELVLYLLKMYLYTKNELSRSKLSKVIVLQTYRQSEIEPTENVPRRFAGGK